MRTRLRRLGAASAIGLGALLLATVLASPALAWHSSVDVTSECLDDGQIRPIPGTGGEGAVDYLMGLGHCDGRRLILIDIDRLMSIQRVAAQDAQHAA